MSGYAKIPRHFYIVCEWLDDDNFETIFTTRHLANAEEMVLALTEEFVYEIFNRNANTLNIKVAKNSLEASMKVQKFFIKEINLKGE
jgi:hypothetical protein